jgi:hypothetical protein
MLEEQKSRIIEQLKDDSEYYRGIGKFYLSNSDIGVLLSNPQLFGKTRDDNKNFAEGRLFHQLLLEPEKAADTMYVDCSTRTTNIYKEFVTVNNLDFALLKSEYDNIVGLTQVMKKNIKFFDDIYADGNQVEKPAIGEICGRMWKGKTDIECNDFLIDLKTTSDIASFRWSAKKYNYDSQAYIYQRLFGKPLAFYAIDKVTKQVGIYHCSDEFIKGGEDKVRMAVEVHEKYFGASATEDVENYFINETL